MDFPKHVADRIARAHSDYQDGLIHSAAARLSAAGAELRMMARQRELDALKAREQELAAAIDANIAAADDRALRLERELTPPAAEAFQTRRV